MTLKIKCNGTVELNTPYTFLHKNSFIMCIMRCIERTVIICSTWGARKASL